MKVGLRKFKFSCLVISRDLFLNYQKNVQEKMFYIFRRMCMEQVCCNFRIMLQDKMDYGEKNGDGWMYGREY